MILGSFPKFVKMCFLKKIPHGTEILQFVPKEKCKRFNSS